MATIKPTLIRKLQQLPPQRLAQVADFVEFLTACEERAAAGARLGKSLAKLDALNLPPLSDEEVESEIQAARVIVRVVLDTNTLVSALLSPHGPPRRLLDDARAQVFELCSSPVLMAELLDVLSREKFAKSLVKAGLTPLGIVGEIRRLTAMALL